MNAQLINTYKNQNRFRHAGQVAALLGHDSNYGCHFGMRSTREAAREEYVAGYNEIVSLFR